MVPQEINGATLSDHRCFGRVALLAVYLGSVFVYLGTDPMLFT